MKKIIFGLFWVFLFLTLFTLFGGGKILKWGGKEIIDLGDRVISYEEIMKGKAANLWKGVEKKGEKMKKKFED